MDLRKINQDLSVSGQLKPSDLTLVKSLGYHSVVCNRPDGEAEDQPLFESIETAARLSDIQTRYLPVTTDASISDAVGAFRRMMRDLPKPILLYCRSGARSAQLAKLALSGRSDS